MRKCVKERDIIMNNQAREIERRRREKDRLRKRKMWEGEREGEKNSILFFIAFRVCQVSESLKKSLAEVVNEGLLNSVLPYLTPSTHLTHLTQLKKSASSASGTGLSGGIGVNKVKFRQTCFTLLKCVCNREKPFFSSYAHK